MKQSVLGFDQKKIIELNLTIKDVLLLDYIIDAIASPTMQHIVRNDIAYVWINHDRLIQDLPILNISKRSIVDYFNKLKESGLIEVINVCNDSNRGSKAFYTITEKCELLRYDRTQKTVSGQRPNAENCKSDNTNISNNLNNQQELFTDNKNIKRDMSNKIHQFVTNYNSICKSLPKCHRLTSKREKGIVKILKIFSDDEIIECFNKLEESDFCSGRSGKWRANFDFILSENNFTKILDGNYDNRERRCNVETISRGPKKQLSEEERERIIKNGQKF